MKASGIVRKLDSIGRIVIPKEIRNVLGINDGDFMEIIKVDNEVVVRRYIKGCIFCGSDKGGFNFKDILICNECREALKGN